MAGKMSWKEFEAINSRLQKAFAKNGNVSSNIRLDGKTSKTKRQIDVVIRAKVGTEQLLVICECKRWNRKITVPGVEAFAGVKHDVGANAAMMVSTKGFSEAAFNTAKANGISLYRYQDTLDAAWPSGIVTNVLMEFWDLIPTQALFVMDDGSEEPVSEDNDELIDNRTGKESPPAGVIRQVWDSLDPTEKFERVWIVTLPCTTPERPGLRGLKLGAISKKMRGYREGRLQFEGLIDESKGHANVDKWKMIFDGRFIPLPEDAPPESETYSLIMSTTHVRTLDRRTETNFEALQREIIEITVRTPEVSILPIRRDSAPIEQVVTR